MLATCNEACAELKFKHEGWRVVVSDEHTQQDLIQDTVQDSACMRDPEERHACSDQVNSAHLTLGLSDTDADWRKCFCSFLQASKTGIWGRRKWRWWWYGWHGL